MFINARQNIVPLLFDVFSNHSLGRICIAFAGPSTANGLAFACRAGFAIAVYWGDGPVHGPYACSKGGKVVPAIVILILLAAGGGAWLGFRAGYRRGWQARDDRDADEGHA
jgi:hypothetical protein